MTQHAFNRFAREATILIAEIERNPQLDLSCGVGWEVDTTVADRLAGLGYDDH